MTKDAPIAVIIQEIPKFGGAVSQELGEDQRCIFIINHIITALNL